MDFCYGWIQFPSLKVSLPAGISFNITNFWRGLSDSQTLNFVCCERNKETGRGPGKIFWCVVFELVKEGDKEEDIPGDAKTEEAEVEPEGEQPEQNLQGEDNHLNVEAES